MRVRFTKGHSNVDYVSFLKPGSSSDIVIEVPKEPGCMPKAMARSVIQRALGHEVSLIELSERSDGTQGSYGNLSMWQATELLLKVMQDELMSRGHISVVDVTNQLKNVSQLLLIPRPAIEKAKIDKIASDLTALYKQWQALPAGQTIALDTSLPQGGRNETELFCVESNNEQNNDRDN